MPGLLGCSTRNQAGDCHALVSLEGAQEDQFVWEIPVEVALGGGIPSLQVHGGPEQCGLGTQLDCLALAPASLVAESHPYPSPPLVPSSLFSRPTE